MAYPHSRPFTLYGDVNKLLANSSDLPPKERSAWEVRKVYYSSAQYQNASAGQRYPTMNDEAAVLNHYNLSTPNPTVWPTERDDSDDSEFGDDFNEQGGARRSRSRYSALERSGSDRRPLIPGSEKLKNGQENLVQKDEADPLGGPESVVNVLRRKALPVDEDTKLRNRFLLSSTTFSPSLYLSHVKSDASVEELQRGLESLNYSIEQKSASLKELVESNFERFVRAKTTIDNVYAEMRNRGAEAEEEKPKTHMRVRSRESAHFRKLSGQATQTNPSNEKKKNALTKESEYGVQGIKAPLTEAAVKAEEIWGPALGGRQREGSLRQILGSIVDARGIFLVQKAVGDAIKRRDYDSLVEEYKKAKRYADEAHDLGEAAAAKGVEFTESEVNLVVITARMWLDVEEKVENFKKDIWRRLTYVQMSQASQNTSTGDGDDHMALISVLLELGVEDNPIWVWLLSRYDYLKSKISATFERSRVEIEVLRRRLANGDKPEPETMAQYLRQATQKDKAEKVQSLDTATILELWDLVYSSMSILLSVPGGILGELIEFWGKAQVFIEGKVQKTLPVGIDGRSRKHHRLSTDGVRDLQNGTNELVEMLQDHVTSFFSDPPIEDISSLVSPTPNTPVTPQSATLSPYAHQDSRFKFDEQNPPPASPKLGYAWEEFAFWPPYSNSLSGTHYLDKMLSLVGTSASEMVLLRPVASGSGLREKLKTTVALARERSVKAACTAWNRDAELCKYFEDWSRTNEEDDITNLPARFSAFETAILSGMQKILYIPEAANVKAGAVSVVSPPPPKLVHHVRSQFVNSLYKALSGMVENAERSKPRAGAESAVTSGSISDPVSGTAIPLENDQNIRKLLTLSNLKLLQSEVVPQLIQQFEINFSTPLIEESKTIRDVLSQISDRLFTSYTQPIAKRLTGIIRAGIMAPDWMPTSTRPSNVRPYIYEALLHLVNVHTEVSTTAGPLTNTILSHLLEQMSLAFLHAFEQRDRYPLGALCQATLDVEFVAQTLSQYTTKAASETQSRLYVALDERTTQDASKQLQGELPEMRVILKRLREGTRNEFLCFKRERGRATTQTER